MTFKNLNIDRSKIDETIQEWAALEELAIPQKKGAALHYCVSKDGCEVRLLLYFKKDGTTTIDPTTGKNPEKSKELAECIKGKCLITKRKNFSLSFKDVSNEYFSLLLEFLQEDLQATILEDSLSGAQRLVKIKGQFDDVITITYYQNKTVRLQGKPLNLYIEIKLFFYEILSFEQVVQKEAETYEIDLDVNEIRFELEAYLPTAYDFLEEKLRKIITPSLSLVKLEIQLEDYSSFVYPVLRGLEGYIRQLLLQKGKEDGVKKVNKLGSLFVEDGNNYSRLQEFAKLDIGCDDTFNAIEKSYNFWKVHRNGLFHVDRPIEMARIIFKKEASEALINEALNIIEETYREINR